MTPQPQLARAIEARTQALALESVAPFHQDPFWRARYGEARTRKFGSNENCSRSDSAYFSSHAG